MFLVMFLVMNITKSIIITKNVILSLDLLTILVTYQWHHGACVGSFFMC